MKLPSAYVYKVYMKQIKLVFRCGMWVLFPKYLVIYVQVPSNTKDFEIGKHF